MDNAKPDAPEWLFEQIVNNTGDAIIFADRDGVIRLWNSGAEAIFGYHADEALGRTLDLIIPERYRERHWTGYRRVLATGVTRYGRELLAVPSQRKDGTPISLEFSLALMADGHGGYLGAAAIIRDVTERWRRERESKERLSQLETLLEERQTGR